MIHVICPGSRSEAGNIVEAAMRRSCGKRLVCRSSITIMMGKPSPLTVACWVLIDPLEAWSLTIIEAIQGRDCKILLLGAIPPTLASHLNMTVFPVGQTLKDAVACVPAPSHQFTESEARVTYIKGLASFLSPIQSRPFLRYDFTDEWNNLGYGAIKADDSIWAIATQALIATDNCIAEVSTGEQALSAYCGLWDAQANSLLWFNRPVGPVDSQEWSLIEYFLANYRNINLPCWPVIREIPHGHDGAVTMRLDCDEDIESARTLWETYQTLDIPFSLALHAAVLPDERQHLLPQQVLEKGGAILSHTATHAANWGGSYDAAYHEAISSAQEVLQVTGHRVRYAVSPFHQTPDYARAALADAGYKGCIGGIIRNDPDFLMARAGLAPGSADGFIGHSQQCMLHGDCVLEGTEPLAIFKQAFDMAKAGGAFFGYLDHPFSPRYQYGWLSEAQRITMHREFISYLKLSDNILFCNQTDALDFLSDKAAIELTMQSDGFQVIPSAVSIGKWQVSVEYKDKITVIPPSGIVL